MADNNDSSDVGDSRELAIIARLREYISNCLSSLDPPARIGCEVGSQSDGIRIHCSVEVAPETLSEAEKLLRSELRIISQIDSASAATVQLEVLIPATAKRDDDHGNQVFALELVGALEESLPNAEAVVATIPLTEASNPNFGLSAKEINHVIVLLHGIRDIGAWQTQVSSQLVEIGTVVEQIRYGLYPAVRFLFPLDLSGGPVKKVLKRLNSLRNQYPHAKMSVIAHSFGTYVFLKAMQKDMDLQFWKIIFCGSVADDQFEWSDHKRRVGDGIRATRDFVLNDCGTGDFLPLLGAAFGWHYGMAGATGFSEGFVTNRFLLAMGGAKGGHGLYFDSKFVQTYWRPFLIEDVAPTGSNGQQGQHLSWLMRILYHGWARIICKLIAACLWIAVAIAIVSVVWMILTRASTYLPQWLRRDATPISELVTAYHNAKSNESELNAFRDRRLNENVVGEAVILEICEQGAYIQVGLSSSTEYSDQLKVYLRNNGDFARICEDAIVPISAAIQDVGADRIILKDCTISGEIKKPVPRKVSEVDFASFKRRFLEAIDSGNLAEFERKWIGTPVKWRAFVRESIEDETNPRYRITVDSTDTDAMTAGATLCTFDLRVLKNSTIDFEAVVEAVRKNGARLKRTRVTNVTLPKDADSSK